MKSNNIDTHDLVDEIKTKYLYIAHGGDYVKINKVLRDKIINLINERIEQNEYEISHFENRTTDIENKMTHIGKKINKLGSEIPHFGANSNKIQDKLGKVGNKMDNFIHKLDMTKKEKDEYFIGINNRRIKNMNNKRLIKLIEKINIYNDIDLYRSEMMDTVSRYSGVNKSDLISVYKLLNMDINMNLDI